VWSPVIRHALLVKGDDRQRLLLEGWIKPFKREEERERVEKKKQKQEKEKKKQERNQRGFNPVEPRDESDTLLIPHPFYRKFGLFYEDLFIERPQVQEALRRLPDDLMQARLRRMKTASQCYATGTELPKGEWVTEEQDVPYLTPYLNEVQREDHDRIAFWN